MASMLDIPSSLKGIETELAARILDVQARFDLELESELPPVSRLCRHVERYRGKMLRPLLVLSCGLAAHPRSAESPQGLINERHVMTAAVCEMVHMATLVHDDVLDEADTRRRGQTVNRLYGNEAAVILGDYLIATSFHLCSKIDQHTSLTVARASTTMCVGELLQLHHRNDHSLDEATYFEVVERKTAALIAAACELGGYHSGASTVVQTALREFGVKLGVAFQIQDDLLDLTGAEAVVGKTLGRDLAKGKLTLPIIHHLASSEPEIRGRSLRLLESAGDESHPDSTRAAASLVQAVKASNSVEHSAAVARRLSDEAKGLLTAVTESPARELLRHFADAAVTRSA